MKRLMSIIGVVALGLLGGMLSTQIVQAGRNASGTYSLPAGNPVTSGTAISSTWANSTLADLAQGVTDSADRQGRGGFLAPVRGIDGNATAPAFSFSNATGTGWYRDSGAMALAFSGSKKAYFDTSGNLFSHGILTNDQGTATSVQGNSADGASAVGVVLDNTAALANAAAKLVSIKNAGVEKASFDKDGNLTLPATAPGSGQAPPRSYVDARGIIASARVSAAGAILAQNGAITLTGAGTSPPNAKFSTGGYKITVTGVTANAILVASGNGSNTVVAASYLSANTVLVACFVDTTGTALDCDFSLLVVAL